MLRFAFLLLLAAVLPAPGQPGVAPLVTRPVLGSLPSGPGQSVVSTTRLAVAVPAVSIPPLATIPPSSPLEERPTGDDVLRLQIFLDEANFGPGVIDGRPGRFTELAVYAWNEVNGHPVDDWAAVNRAARKAVPNPLAVALVPDCV